MDDLKIIVYIVIGLIYFFARRKKKEEPAKRPRTTPKQAHVEEAPRSAPKTFEELLREIEGMKRPAPPPVSRQPEPVVVDYDDDLPDQRVDYDDTLPDFRKQETYQAYEAAKTEAFARPSLEDTVKLEDTIVRFSTFKGYEKDARRNLLGEYVQELKNPQRFKKAFILSEILRPKF